MNAPEMLVCQSGMSKKVYKLWSLFRSCNWLAWFQTFELFLISSILLMNAAKWQLFSWLKKIICNFIGEIKDVDSSNRENWAIKCNKDPWRQTRDNAVNGWFLKSLNHQDTMTSIQLNEITAIIEFEWKKSEKIFSIELSFVALLCDPDGTEFWRNENLEKRKLSYRLCHVIQFYFTLLCFSALFSCTMQLWDSSLCYVTYLLDKHQ